VARSGAIRVAESVLGVSRCRVVDTAEAAADSTSPR
jgi:hypothetical protein